MTHSCKPWTLPSNYSGLTWEGWHTAGFGRSRDSDVLEESNFQVALVELQKLNTELNDETENCGESVTVVSENHWAAGWVEWIAIHSSNAAALAKAQELCNQANNYPVLDESHFSDLEYTRAMDFWESLSLAGKVDFCRDCRVSIFAARRSHNLPDRLYEALTR